MTCYRLIKLAIIIIILVVGLCGSDLSGFSTGLLWIAIEWHCNYKWLIDLNTFFCLSVCLSVCLQRHGPACIQYVFSRFQVIVGCISSLRSANDIDLIATDEEEASENDSTKQWPAASRGGRQGRQSLAPPPPPEWNSPPPPPPRVACLFFTTLTLIG